MDFLKDLLTKDNVTAFIAAYAALVATFNFAWPRIQEWKDARAAIFKALQGEKESIAEVAHKVTQEAWDKQLSKDKFRNRLIAALSMAFIFESSDRSKAYVIDALQHIANINSTYKCEIVESLDGIERIFTKYVNLMSDRKFEQERIVPLRTVIKAF